MLVDPDGRDPNRSVDDLIALAVIVAFCVILLVYYLLKAHG